MDHTQFRQFIYLILLHILIEFGVQRLLLHLVGPLLNLVYPLPKLLLLRLQRVNLFLQLVGVLFDLGNLSIKLLLLTPQCHYQLLFRF
jgi:hypothetical protein